MKRARQLAPSWSSYYRASVWVILNLSTIAIEAAASTMMNSEEAESSMLTPSFIMPLDTSYRDGHNPAAGNDDINRHHNSNEEPEYRLYLRRIGGQQLRQHDHRRLVTDNLSMELSIAMGVTAVLLACILVYFQFIKQYDDDDNGLNGLNGENRANYDERQSIRQPDPYTQQAQRLQQQHQQQQQQQQQLQQRQQQQQQLEQQQEQRIQEQQQQQQRRQGKIRPNQQSQQRNKEQQQQQRISHVSEPLDSLDQSDPSQHHQQEFLIQPSVMMARQFSSDRLLTVDRYSMHDIPEGTHSGRSSTVFSKMSKNKQHQHQQGSDGGRGGSARTIGSSRRSDARGGGNLSNSRHSSKRSNYDTTTGSDVSSSGNHTPQRTIAAGTGVAIVAAGSARSSQRSKGANSSSRRSNTTNGSGRRFMGVGGGSRNGKNNAVEEPLLESSSASSHSSSSDEDEYDDLYYERTYEESFYSKTESSPASGTTESYRYPPDTPSDRGGDGESVGVYSQPKNRIDEEAPQLHTPQELAPISPPQSMTETPDNLIYEHSVDEESAPSSLRRPPSPPSIHRDIVTNATSSTIPKSTEIPAGSGNGKGIAAVASLAGIGLTSLALTPLLKDNDDDEKQKDKDENDQVEKIDNDNGNAAHNKIQNEPRKENDTKLKHHNEEIQQVKMNNQNREVSAQEPVHESAQDTASLGEEHGMALNRRVPFEVFAETQQKRPSLISDSRHSLSSIPEWKSLSASDSSFGDDSYLDYNDEITGMGDDASIIDDLDRTLIRGKTSRNQQLIQPPVASVAQEGQICSNLKEGNNNNNVVDDSLGKGRTNNDIQILGPTVILAQSKVARYKNDSNSEGSSKNDDNDEDDTEKTDSKKEILVTPRKTIIQNHANSIDTSSTNSDDDSDDDDDDHDLDRTLVQGKTASNRQLLGPSLSVAQQNDNDDDDKDLDQTLVNGKTDSNRQLLGPSLTAKQNIADESNIDDNNVHSNMIDNNRQLWLPLSTIAQNKSGERINAVAVNESDLDPLSRKLKSIDQRDLAGPPILVENTSFDSDTSSEDDNRDPILIQEKVDSNGLLGQMSLKRFESEREMDGDDVLNRALVGEEANSNSQLLGQPALSQLQHEKKSNTQLFVPLKSKASVDDQMEAPRNDQPSSGIQPFAPLNTKTLPNQFIADHSENDCFSQSFEPANVLQTKNISQSTGPRDTNNPMAVSNVVTPIAFIAAPTLFRQNNNNGDDTKREEPVEHGEEGKNTVPGSEAHTFRQASSTIQRDVQKNNDIPIQREMPGKFSPALLMDPLPVVPMALSSSGQDRNDNEEGISTFHTVQQEQSRKMMTLGDEHFTPPISPHSETKKSKPASLSEPQLVFPVGTSSDIGSVASEEEKKEDQEIEKKKWTPKLLNPWNKEPLRKREVERLSHQGEERYSMKCNVMDSRSLAGSLRSTTDSSVHSISLDRIPEEDTLVASNLEAFRAQVLQAARWSNSSSISSNEASSSISSRSDREWYEEIQALQYKFDPKDDIAPCESIGQSVSSEATSLQFPDSPDRSSIKYMDHYTDDLDQSESDSEPILPLRLAIDSTLKSSNNYDENRRSANVVFAPSVTIEVMESHQDIQNNIEPQTGHPEKDLPLTNAIKNLKEQKRILESNFRKVSSRPVVLQRQGSFRTRDTTDTSHTSLPGSEVGIVCLTSAQDVKEDKEDAMSFLSCTASERKAMREAEEELLEGAQKSSLVIDKKGATLLDEADGEQEWENEAHDMMLKIRSRVGKEYQDSDHNATFSAYSASSDLSDEFPQKQTSTKSLVDETDELLEDMHQDEWEAKAEENMKELKYRIRQLTAQENTDAGSDFDRRVLNFLTDTP